MYVFDRKKLNFFFFFLIPVLPSAVPCEQPGNSGVVKRGNAHLEFSLCWVHTTPRTPLHCRDLCMNLGFFVPCVTLSPTHFLSNTRWLMRLMQSLCCLQPVKDFFGRDVTESTTRKTLQKKGESSFMNHPCVTPGSGMVQTRERAAKAKVFRCHHRHALRGGGWHIREVGTSLGVAHFMGVAYPWWILTLVVTWLMTGRGVASMGGGVNQRSRCSWYHWSSNSYDSTPLKRLTNVEKQKPKTGVEEAHCCDTSRSFRILTGWRSKGTSSEQGCKPALVKQLLYRSDMLIQLPTEPASLVCALW